MTQFDWSMLSPADRETAKGILGYPEHWAMAELPRPDLTIAPDGMPYIYRWHIIPRAGAANCYLHVQVADDPERPLHDHPWDNFSVILSGGYREHICECSTRPNALNTFEYDRVFGQAIFRRAAWSHRLFLPKHFPYTMTLFSTGPKVREWGFWFEDKWVPYTEVTRMKGGMSVHIKREN